MNHLKKVYIVAGPHRGSSYWLDPARNRFELATSRFSSILYVVLPVVLDGTRMLFAVPASDSTPIQDYLTVQNLLECFTHQGEL